jgi:hypothetical protein
MDYATNAVPCVGVTARGRKKRENSKFKSRPPRYLSEHARSRAPTAAKAPPTPLSTSQHGIYTRTGDATHFCNVSSVLGCSIYCSPLSLAQLYLERNSTIACTESMKTVFCKRIGAL